MKRQIAAILVIALLLCLFTACSPDAEEIDWENIRLGQVLPEPKSNLMEIISNDDDSLVIYVHKTTENEYLEYQRWCENDKGFDVEREIIGTSFYAYNQEGYYLTLLYDDNQDKMHISLDAPISMETFTLPEYAVAAGLPVPGSNIGHYNWQDSDSFSMYVGETSKDDYILYKDTCVAAGFTGEPYEYDTVYSATNAEGYKVSLNYKGFNTFSLEFYAPDDSSVETTYQEETTEDYTLDYVDAESFESALNSGTEVEGKIVQFEVNEYKPDSALGINCWAGEHLNFISENGLDVEAGDTIVGRVTEEPTKFFGSWEIHYEVLSIGGEEVEEGILETVPDASDDAQNKEITLTMGEEDFKGMNYQEAEEKLREMGFTKFEYRTVDTEIEADADTICYIEITEWTLDTSDYVKGDAVNADATITFFSYKYEAPEAPSPVFYSTNDYETAKEGNVGVFSYVDNGSSYDIYWIIDFDEGYIYYFTDGNGETFCDRLKIDSGTLNDAITVTYHDGGDTWSYKLHFKYINHPETLIMVDQNGFDWQYSTTDLDDALALRATKTIKDY